MTSLAPKTYDQHQTAVLPMFDALLIRLDAELDRLKAENEDKKKV